MEVLTRGEHLTGKKVSRIERETFYTGLQIEIEIGIEIDPFLGPAYRFR